MALFLSFLLKCLWFCFANFQAPPTHFPVSSVASSTPHSIQGQMPPSSATFTKGASPAVRPMYPPSSSVPQGTGAVPTYPATSAVSQATTPFVSQPGSVPTYPPSGAVSKSPYYPTPPSSKPAQVGPGVGVRSAAESSNYTGSLTDGFNSMRLQVCWLLLLVAGIKC